MINECFERYGLDKKGILAYTMPGLGTGEKSKNNACKLAEYLGIKLKTIDIKEEVLHHFNLIGKDDDNKDVTFENVSVEVDTTFSLTYKIYVSAIATNMKNTTIEPPKPPKMKPSSPPQRKPQQRKPKKTPKQKTTT